MVLVVQLAVPVRYIKVVGLRKDPGGVSVSGMMAAFVSVS
jgi:hypothetical protein